MTGLGRSSEPRSRHTRRGHQRPTGSGPSKAPLGPDPRSLLGRLCPRPPPEPVVPVQPGSGWRKGGLGLHGPSKLRDNQEVLLHLRVVLPGGFVPRRLSAGIGRSVRWTKPWRSTSTRTSYKMVQVGSCPRFQDVQGTEEGDTPTVTSFPLGLGLRSPSRRDPAVP